jgi:hypothetical protein
MWVFLRFATLIAVYCARVMWRGRRPKVVSTSGDFPLAERWATNKRGEITRRWYGTPYDQPVAFRLSRESPLDRWFKLIGLSTEQQTGDPKFDELVYVACDHEGFARMLKLDASARAAVLDLLESQRARSIFSDGAYLWIEGRGVYAPSEEERGALQRLHAALRTVRAPAGARTDRFFTKVLAIEAVIWSVASYGVSGVLEWLFSADDTRFLDQARLVLLGLVVAAGLFAGMLTLIALALRGSSRGHRIVTESVAVLLIGLPMTGIQLVADLDVHLDWGRGREVVAEVIEKTQRRRRRRPDRYYLQLRWPSESGEPTTELLRVERHIFERAREGGGAQVVVHPGALGVAWIEAVCPD